MLTDFFLIAKIKEGDVHAFETLFRRYYAPLCWYSASMTGSMEVGEEVVEELFYTLWRDRSELNVLRSVKSYLYGAVRNESLQYCQHLEVRDRYSEQVLAVADNQPTDDPHRQMEYRELEQLIQQTITRMPERRQSIFKMHRLEGKTYVEIAAALSLSVKTIEAEMSKALRTLRNDIENYTQLT
ncbi:MAG: RNA polymerase sigma-70 factor [Bacteroidia bacterium]|nr:RNA polymerase sigma-70 factor [Bacteroidia bacterium]